MNVYFISGLGADRRAFEKIQLDAAYTAHYIDWIEPLAKESIQAYANRLSDDIDFKKPFVLCGLSFGGIMAIEIAKQYPCKKVILISSISHRDELPKYYRLLGKLKIHQTPFLRLLKTKNAYVHHLFGVNAKRLKIYLDEMIQKTTLTYLRWSLDNILSWQQKSKPDFVFHIHGDADKLFPIKNCNADKIVNKGGHFMVITHAKLISEIINDVLKSL
ncbi:MAG: alpha/beta hydrolase [Bacteroidetes bacterium]|nr:alpha/beta hydrolase [Bacteroidota bacterium]